MLPARSGACARCGRSAGRSAAPSRRRHRCDRPICRSRRCPPAGARARRARPCPARRASLPRARRRWPACFAGSRSPWPVRPAPAGAGSSRWPAAAGARCPGCVGGGADRDITGDHRDLRLEIDAPGRSAKTASSWARAVVAAALVHTRVGVKSAGASLPRARLSSSTWFEEGRAVGPLVGAWQRRHALLRLEGEGMARLALVQRRGTGPRVAATGSSSRRAPAAAAWRCRWR